MPQKKLINKFCSITHIYNVHHVSLFSWHSKCAVDSNTFLKFKFKKFQQGVWVFFKIFLWLNCNAQVQVWLAPLPIHSCVGAIANRGQWEQGCSLFMATDLGPVRATQEKKMYIMCESLSLNKQLIYYKFNHFVTCHESPSSITLWKLNKSSIFFCQENSI